MKKYILTNLSLLIFFFSYAQSSMPYQTDKAAQFYVGVGGAYNNLKNLNPVLADAGLPTIGKLTFAGVAEGELRNKNLIFGLSSGRSAYAKRSGNYNTSLICYSGSANIGYYIVNRKNFHVAPQAGIGFFSSQVKITQRNGFTDFNQLLSNKNSIDMNQNTGVLDFCLKFDIADFTKDKTCLTGFRLGYKYGLSERGWGIDETNNTTVADSPKDRINQLYLLATIGLLKMKPQK